MQVSAEQLLEREQYGHSLSAVRMLGSVAVERSLPELLQEPNGYLTRVWNDFYTRLEEHLATDPEYGEQLIFDNSRTLEIVDGHAVTEHGEQVIDMVRNGETRSIKAIESDPRMAIQAERDKNDTLLALAVDQLEVGEMIGALSMDPKDAIKDDKDFWENHMNYREGMAIWQWYYRVSETELKAGVICIKRSDTQAMRKAFAKLGYLVPKDVKDEQWLTLHMRKAGSINDAKQLGHQLKKYHREFIGDARKEYSVTDFLARQDATVQKYFATYVPKLAEATHTKTNDKRLQELARALAHVDSIDWAKRVQLMQISKRTSFEDADARLMDEMITYALVEELRKELPTYMYKETNSTELLTTPISLRREQMATFVYGAVLQQQKDLIRQMVQNVRAGTEAKRSYGGCSGSSLHSRDVNGEVKSTDELFGLQDIFGGKLRENVDAEDTAEDSFGALVFHCTEGHRNERKRGELLEKCQVSSCKGMVCAPKEEKPKPAPLWKKKLATLVENNHGNKRKQFTAKAA